MIKNALKTKLRREFMRKVRNKKPTKNLPIKCVSAGLAITSIYKDISLSMEELQNAPTCWLLTKMIVTFRN